MGEQTTKDRELFVTDMTEKFSRFWNNGEVSLARELCAPDFVRHEPGGVLVEGPDALAEHVLNMRIQYPDMLITFKENIFDGEKMVVLWRFEGTDAEQNPQSELPPTGKKLSYDGVDILHFSKESKISEDRVIFNMLVPMQQAGHIPELFG